MRRIAAWNRCTKLAETEKALALYTHLSGRAWLFVEELDVDRLGSWDGMAYYLEWVRVRFMEIEINKVGAIMNELFRKCRKRADQTVRDYNMEFERLLLRLGELNCELPNLVKAWLYVDRLKLSEHDEVALLSSVGNQYDLRALQQAAMIQDRGVVAKKTWDRNPGRWKSVHVTAAGGGDSDGDDDLPDVEAVEESDSELVDEGVASEMHSAYMAFQDAKSKYREALKGRGFDKEELKKRTEERLKLAKARSYCAACKRRGHWHKDPECPLRGTTTASKTHEPKNAQMSTHHVQMCCMVEQAGYVLDVNDALEETYVPVVNGPNDVLVETYVPAADYVVEEPFADRDGRGGGLNIVSAENYIVAEDIIDKEHYDIGSNFVLEEHYGDMAVRGGTGLREVWMTHEAEGDGAEVGIAYDEWHPGKQMLAIADTACTKTVAGHQWYEEYCAWADSQGVDVELVEEKDSFKFGASRVHASPFAVWARFGLGGHLISVKVAVVQCKVPLLLSRGSWRSWA